MKRQHLGKAGEEFAVRYLQQQGLEIVACNWHPPHGNELRGDIDIIARESKNQESSRRESNVLCFVEVKARASEERGAPQLAVTRVKQKRLSRLANAYVSVERLDEVPCRFDVIEVWLNEREARAVWHCNAFEYQE